MLFRLFGQHCRAGGGEVERQNAANNRSLHPVKRDAECVSNTLPV